MYTSKVGYEGRKKEQLTDKLDNKLLLHNTYGDYYLVFQRYSFPVYSCIEYEFIQCMYTDKSRFQEFSFLVLFERHFKKN